MCAMSPDLTSGQRLMVESQHMSVEARVAADKLDKLEAENDKLRELVSEYVTVADNLCRDGFQCTSGTRCRYYHECGGKFYCRPGELKQMAKSLGIEVPDGRA